MVSELYSKKELVQHNKDLNKIFKDLPKELVNYILSFDSLYHSIKDYITIILNIVLDQVEDTPPKYLFFFGFNSLSKKNFVNIYNKEFQVSKLIPYFEWHKKGVLRKPKKKIEK